MPAPIPPRRVIPKKAVGEIFQALSKRQSNWLLCDGSNYNTEEYPELAGILSNYGLEPGTLPDCRPRYEGKEIEVAPGQFVEGYGSYLPTYIVASQVGRIVAD
jgi:hypothetical protein